MCVVPLLNSWLAGTAEVPTDFTNAMKTGVNLETEQWAENMPALRLPEVIAPGRKFGTLREDLRARWQLPADIALVSGATDSNAAFYASGAAAAGDGVERQSDGRRAAQGQTGDHV